MSKEAVNKELANRLKAPEPDPLTRQASEAILGLFETQQPSVAFVSPNQHVYSYNEEEDEDPEEHYNSCGTYQLGQSLMSIV